MPTSREIIKRLRFDDKKSLNRAKTLLSPLAKECRRYFKHGDQCVILKQNEETVLVITSHKAATAIELVRAALTKAEHKKLLAIPKLVAIDANIGELLDPVNPGKSLRRLNSEYTISHRNIYNKNIVYELPLYAGTLEDLNQIVFEKDSITKLSKKLYAALDLLHSEGITHGDISERNMFYAGQYPHYQFILGDFGKASTEVLNFQQRKLLDLYQAKRMLNKIQSVVDKKHEWNKENGYYNKSLPSLANAARTKKGLSPRPLRATQQRTLRGAKKMYLVRS